MSSGQLQWNSSRGEVVGGVSDWGTRFLHPPPTRATIQSTAERNLHNSIFSRRNCFNSISQREMLTEFNFLHLSYESPVYAYLQKQKVAVSAFLAICWKSEGRKQPKNDLWGLKRSGRVKVAAACFEGKRDIFR